MADPISKHVRELHDAVSVFGKTLKAAAKKVPGLSAEEILSVMTGVVSETKKTLELAELRKESAFFSAWKTSDSWGGLTREDYDNARLWLQNDASQHEQTYVLIPRDAVVYLDPESAWKRSRKKTAPDAEPTTPRVTTKNTAAKKSRKRK